MIEWVDMLRLAHVLGANVLIGTGAGIAFFMLMAHRSADPTFVAKTASVVVVADMVFTATAAILQPITGYLLMRKLGWTFKEGWIVASLALYVFIGLFWLPVVNIQAKMRDEAQANAASGVPLSARYHQLYRIWFICGFPAFGAIVILLWLMLTRPYIPMFG